jgi:beta-galactosidase
MYPPVGLIVEYAETREDYRPVIMCEYSHAMGNASGSLSDYWKAIESHHGLQGGFIWDWIDQGIAAELPADRTDGSAGRKYWKYGGDFGDMPTDYDFCINGLNFPDMTPKPAMEECRKLFAPVRLHPVHPLQGMFEVENRYDFTTLDTLKLVWSLLRNGVTVKTGMIQFPAAEPGERIPIAVPVAQQLSFFRQDDEAVLHIQFVYAADTAWSKSGDICGYDEYVLRPAEGWIQYPDTERKKRNIPLPERIEPVLQTLVPVLFRPLLENECIKKLIPVRHEQIAVWNFENKPTNAWLDADLPHMITTENSDGTFGLYTGPEAYLRNRLGTVTCIKTPCKSPAGEDAIQMDITFELSDVLPEYPRAGIAFRISSRYTRAGWYGRGFQECYQDRKAGALIGWYTSDIGNLEVPYIVPQENGSRCDVRYLLLEGSLETTAPIHIQSLTPFTFSISRYEMADVWKSGHPAELTDTTTGKEGYWTVTIDAAHRGVGTGACGPDTLEQYRIRPGIYRLSLKLW